MPISTEKVSKYFRTVCAEYVSFDGDYISNSNEMSSVRVEPTNAACSPLALQRLTPLKGCSSSAYNEARSCSNRLRIGVL